VVLKSERGINNCVKISQCAEVHMIALMTIILFSRNITLCLNYRLIDMGYILYVFKYSMYPSFSLLVFSTVKCNSKKLRELSCVNFIINGSDLRNNIKRHQVQCHNFLSKNPKNRALYESEVRYLKKERMKKLRT